MTILTVLAAVFALMTVVASAYLIAAAWAVRRFRALPPPRPSARPPITVLKPLCGAEAELLENLHSFCAQDYPAFQIVFGVQSADDPAIGVVRRLMAEHPQADIALVVEARRHGTNRKVGNLLNMLPSAKHPFLIVADSDIRVPPGYLDAIAADLAKPDAGPDAGLITCLYTGRGAEGLWARLGVAFIDHGFLPSVLVGRLMGRRDGCFGATMALSRATLDRLGGLERFRDHLADDYALGAAVRALGQPVTLSPCLVATTVTERTAADLIAHELRWMRTVRAIEPAGHAGSIVTFPVFMSVPALAFGLAAGLPWLGLGAVALALTTRFLAGRAIDRALEQPATPLWLLAARDLLSAGLLVASFCGTTVTWRDARYRVDSDGRLHFCGEEP
ncbi:bacteriohopanetetrol glucosamine biosynthesis glycosyltransferase HpnI [Azospirillum sp. sgz302134]